MEFRNLENELTFEIKNVEMNIENSENEMQLEEESTEMQLDEEDNELKFETPQIISEGKIRDVQVNGISVVNENGIAEIPNTEIESYDELENIPIINVSELPEPIGQKELYKVENQIYQCVDNFVELEVGDIINSENRIYANLPLIFKVLSRLINFSMKSTQTSYSLRYRSENEGYSIVYGSNNSYAIYTKIYEVKNNKVTLNNFENGWYYNEDITVIQKFNQSYFLKKNGYKWKNISENEVITNEESPIYKNQLNKALELNIGSGLVNNRGQLALGNIDMNNFSSKFKSFLNKTNLFFDTLDAENYDDWLWDSDKFYWDSSSWIDKTIAFKCISFGCIYNPISYESLEVEEGDIVYFSYDDIGLNCEIEKRGSWGV